MSGQGLLNWFKAEGLRFAETPNDNLQLQSSSVCFVYISPSRGRFFEVKVSPKHRNPQTLNPRSTPKLNPSTLNPKPLNP